MKKLYRILLAGIAAIAAVSCAPEQLEKLVYDPADAVAPVLNELKVNETELTPAGTYAAVSFTKASYGFPTGITYRLFMDIAQDFSTERAIGNFMGGDAAEGFDVASKDVNNILNSMKCEIGTEIPVYFRLKSYMKGLESTVGGESGILVSNAVSGTAIPFEAEVTYERVWLPGTANGWNHELAQHLFNYKNDAKTFVGVTDFISDAQDDVSANQFKLTGAAGWDNETGNWGIADPSAAPESKTIKLLNGSNDNITQYTAHRYYGFTFDKDALTLTMEVGFETVSVIGTIGGTNWDTDFEMSQDPYRQRFYVDIPGVAAGQEFKFRFDNGWDLNLGGNLDKLTAGGANIVMQDDGDVRIYLDINDWSNPTASWDTGAYGKEITDPYSGDTPDNPDNPDEPTAPTGWGIVGDMNGWGSAEDGSFSDIMMSENAGVFTGYFTAEAGQGFKIRKDGAWDENYGGDMAAPGEAFEAVAGGNNIAAPESGFTKVVFDTTVDPKTITVYCGDDAEVWSLIGSFNSWGGDVDMTGVDGVWTSPATSFTAGTEVKIRHNHDWALSVGGVLETVGTPFAAVSENGPNFIIPEDGIYLVTYDTNEQTITVSTAGWGVVGSINGWGGTPDIPMKEVAGKSYLVAQNVAVTASDEIKIRYNNDWSQGDYGAESNLGHAVKAVKGGSNIKPGIDGAVDVYFFERDEVIIVTEAGSELTYWGVVGTINNWSAPDYIMYEKDGKFIYENLAITASDEIKIRMNEVWNGDRGGSFSAMGEPFAVTDGGSNIKVGGDGTITVTYDPDAETITISGEAEQPEQPDVPTSMYMIGEAFGGWDWASDGVVEFTPVNSVNGAFWAIRYIEAGVPFKFCAQKAWSGDFTGLGEDSGYTVDGGNCLVDKSGVYMIYIDCAAKKLCIEPAKVYGIGGCWDNQWNEGMEAALFTEQDGKLVGKTATAGEIRLYAASSAATTDWWTREFVFFDGKIAYRGNGGDQDRVNVEAGKTVTLDFNAGTATVSDGGDEPVVSDGITIDGDMSDWAAIEGTVNEGSNLAETKGYADADNIYVYVKRMKADRWADLWGGESGKTGYNYYCFDLDNDATTGGENIEGVACEAYTYLYLYGGTKDAPQFRETPPGTGSHGVDISNVKCNGNVTDDAIEVEVAFPRSAMAEPTSDTISVTVWTNKDGGPKTTVSFKVK